MLCASAFPNGISVGKEVLGIEKIAADVRSGKIEKINIKRNKNGKLSVEIVYREESSFFLIEKEDNESYLFDDVRKFGSNGGRNRLNPFCSSFSFNSEIEFRDRKKAVLEARKRCSSVAEERFFQSVTVYDFTSRRKEFC